VTQTPKPGPGPHFILSAEEVERRLVDNARDRLIQAAAEAGIKLVVAPLSYDEWQASLSSQTPNERLLNEIFAAPACAAVDMGLGCTEAAVWTAELTCCHLTELCCTEHRTQIEGSRRDVVCSNCHTPGRMGRLVTFTTYTGSTR
jgi:hypothetical protein